MLFFHPKRRIAFLFQDRLIACLWTGQRLIEEGCFPPTADGRRDVVEYIRKDISIPLYIIVNLIEEEFRLEKIPHALFHDRKALIDRKLSQYFRTTPFRCAQIQDREATGRRDDLALFTSLSNAELLHAWINPMLQAKARILGISSEALLSSHLIKRLNLADVSHLLLATLEESGGLRQTYLQQGRVKFSRYLAQLVQAGANASDMLAGEARTTRHYLERIKLLPRDQNLEVCILADTGNAAQMQRADMKSHLMTFQVYELRALAEHLKINDLSQELPILSTCLAHLLPHAGWPNHYAPPTTARYQTLAGIRAVMQAMSACLVGIGLAVGGLQLHAGLHDMRLRAELDRSSLVAANSYAALRKHFPKPPIAGEDMWAIVHTLNSLEHNSPSPLEMLRILGLALSKDPRIQLVRLHWRVESIEDASASGFSPLPQEELDPLLNGLIENNVRVVLDVDGELPPFKEHKEAHEQVAAFIQALSGSPGITVQALAMPLEFEQTKVTQAKLDDAPETAGFTLRITWKPAP